MQTYPYPYPTWIEINLSAIEQNVRQILRYTGTELMAVVKANAYGHGAIEVARAALSAGASWLAVARCNEGVGLRAAGITAPVLLLSSITSGEADQAIAHDLTLPLASFEMAELLAARARALGKPARVHLKVDTGLGRLGVFPEEALPLARRALELGLELDGLFSHFAMAGVKDTPLTPTQLLVFNDVLQSLEEAGIHPRHVHVSNTAAILFHPAARFNMVRSCEAVLGIVPWKHTPIPILLRPALTAWKARLISCKVFPAGRKVGYNQEYVTSPGEAIGVVSAGYGDGLRRTCKNEILLGGQRVLVVAIPCMDQLIVALPRPYPLDTEAVIVGQQGSESISLHDVGARYGTTAVEVAVNIAPRVQRVYTRDNE